MSLSFVPLSLDYGGLILKLAEHMRGQGAYVELLATNTTSVYQTVRRLHGLPRGD